MTTDAYLRGEVQAPWEVAAFETPTHIGWITDAVVAHAHGGCCHHPFFGMPRRYHLMAGRKIGGLPEEFLVPLPHVRRRLGYVVHGEYNMSTDNPQEAIAAMHQFIASIVTTAVDHTPPAA